MLLGRKIIICLNYMVKIRLHQLKNEIYIFEFSLWWRKHNMFYLYNIRMMKHPKKLNFSEDAYGIRYMLKNIINFLDGNSLTRLAINCRTNNSVASFPNNFLNLVSACFAILCEKVWLLIILQNNQQLWKKNKEKNRKRDTKGYICTSLHWPELLALK